MVTHLPSSQFLRDAKEAQARGKDPVLFLQALVKYWEMEFKNAPTGWARRYSLRMRRGALFALRQLNRDSATPYTPMDDRQTGQEQCHECV